MVFLQRGKPPDIVKPKDMVRMYMGEKNGIDPLDPEGNGLIAKIGWRIENKVRFIRHDIQAAAPPMVFRVLRAADAAIAPNHRNSVRGSRS